MRPSLRMRPGETLFCDLTKSPEPCETIIKKLGVHRPLKDFELLGAARLRISRVRFFSIASLNSFHFSVSLVPRPTQNHAGPLAGVISFVDHDAAVHHHEIDPRRILFRTCARRHIADAL